MQRWNKGRVNRGGGKLFGRQIPRLFDAVMLIHSERTSCLSAYTALPFPSHPASALLSVCFSPLQLVLPFSRLVAQPLVSIQGTTALVTWHDIRLLAFSNLTSANLLRNVSLHQWPSEVWIKFVEKTVTNVLGCFRVEAERGILTPKLHNCYKQIWSLTYLLKTTTVQMYTKNNIDFLAAATRSFIVMCFFTVTS